MDYGTSLRIPGGADPGLRPLAGTARLRWLGWRNAATGDFVMSFTQRILLAMVTGVIVGVFLNVVGPNFQAVSDFLVNGLFYVVGTIFIALLKLMVVPLVLVSLVCGVTALGDLRTLGRVGGKTLGLYLVTTAIAITFALTIANLVDPGQGFELAGDLRPAAALDEKHLVTLMQHCLVVFEIEGGEGADLEAPGALDRAHPLFALRALLGVAPGRQDIGSGYVRPGVQPLIP